MSEVISLAVELINIESISGNENPMADWLEGYLKPRGWEVVRQTVAEGRDNVYAHRPGRSPRLLFNSHIDTVPPFFPARVDETHIHGRGACDTKSLIAAQLLAAQDLIDEGRDDIGLLYVVGEEVDHIGMIKANELGLKPEFLIVGEPTESKLARRQKGILKLRLEARGTAGHSGYPHTGVSAIDPLLDVLQDLRRADWPAADTLGETTLNIGVIGGGRAANVIPDKAFAEALFRVVTSHEEILSAARRIAAGRVDIAVTASNDPCELSLLDGYESAVVSFNTDIPYFEFDGKAFLYGAGSILDAHTAHERIAIKDLEGLAPTYRDLARACLG